MKRLPQSRYPEIIARNLRLLRAQRGLSQEYVALEIDMHRSYLSGLEAAQHNPTINLIARFEPVFGISAVELLASDLFPTVPWEVPDAGQLAFPFREPRRLRREVRPSLILPSGYQVVSRQSERGGPPC